MNNGNVKIYKVSDEEYTRNMETKAHELLAENIELKNKISELESKLAKAEGF